MSPGFLDGHIHIESSMLSVGEYAKAVVPHGTVGIYPDPHEICNVPGLDGVRCMIEDAGRTPLKCMFVTPSCMPAVPGFEDTGSFVGPEDVARTMQWDEIVGLGEMMNFPGILASDDHAHGIVDATLAADKVVTGHYSLPETGAGLNAYAASGIRCCHESTRPEDVIAKMRLGMYAQLRMGSAWQDLPVIAKALTETGIGGRFACLVSDDTHPNTLVSHGHMDYILRVAVENGIDPITAIRMATINTAQCYRMDQDLGAIAPGKCADIVLLKDLEHFDVVRTIIDGETVAIDGKMTRELAPYTYPDWARESVHLKDAVTADTFKIAAPENRDRVTIRAIEVIPARVGDIERFVELAVAGGHLESDIQQDVLKTVGLTGYNTGDYYDGETWRSFNEIYDPLYAEMAPQYNQPLMITEFACSSYGGDKAAWVEDMFTQLENYPRIKAAIWWDSADKDTANNIARPYYIDNDKAALEIFKDHLAQSDYKENPRERTTVLLRPFDLY